MALIRSYIPIFTLLALVFVNPAIAQQKDPTLTDAKPFRVEPALVNPDSMLLPFRSIRIIDVRADTTKIGYVKMNKKYRKLSVEGTLATVVQAHLASIYKQALTPQSPHELTIYIKHLWMQSTSEGEQANQKIINYDQHKNPDYNTCYAVLECYLEATETFTPLFRLDSTFRTRGLLKRSADENLIFPFEAALTKAARLNYGKPRRQFTKPEIEQLYRQASSFNGFENVGLTKGIYRSFRDFLQHTPWNIPFEVDWGSRSDELYSMEDGQKKLVDNCWGFCDGKQYFIKQGYNFFALVPAGNTYEFLGFKGLHQNTLQPSGGLQPGAGLWAPLVSGAMNGMTFEDYKVFQLNMETGKTY